MNQYIILIAKYHIFISFHVKMDFVHFIDSHENNIPARINRV